MRRLAYAIAIVGLCLIGLVSLRAQTIIYPPTSGINKNQTSALASSLIVKAAPAYLYGFSVSADSTLSGAAWWILIYDQTTVPTDGSNKTPVKCYALASGTTSGSFAWPVPIFFSSGVVIVASTTGCFQQTLSAHAFIAGDYQ